MNRLTGIILAILGLVLLVGGLYPSGLLGRLNGVGGLGGHNTADVLVIVGAVALVVGIVSLLRRQQA